MTALMLANHLSSTAVAIACWWLAHSNSRAMYPGKIIAASYGLLGLSVAATGIVREFAASPDTVRWLIVGTKIILATVLVLEVYRRARTSRVLAAANPPSNGDDR